CFSIASPSGTVVSRASVLANTARRVAVSGGASFAPSGFHTLILAVPAHTTLTVRLEINVTAGFAYVFGGSVMARVRPSPREHPMPVTVWPLDAVEGAPEYDGRALRQTGVVDLAYATSARPLGARSGVRPGTPDSTLSTTSTTWTVKPHAGVLDVLTAAEASA